MRALRSLARFLVPMLSILAPTAAGAAQYGAAYTPVWPQSYPPGATLSVSVTLKNTGDLAWIKAPDSQGHYFVLGYHWDGPEVHHAGETVAWPLTTLPTKVFKGNTVKVAAQLPVPSTPGTYTLQWDMMHVGVGWFSGCCGVIGEGAANPGAAKIVSVGTILGGIDPGVLCAFVDCNSVSPAAAPQVGPPKQVCLYPKVEVIPFLTVATQGGGAALKGCGFGALAGQIVMKGLPSGPASLTDLQWSDTGVAGLIPNDLQVVKATQVTFEVTTKGGLKGSSAPVLFTPKMEWKRLPRSAVKVSWCSKLADANICNSVTQTDGDFIGPAGGSEAIRAHHHNNWGSGSDSGVDHYNVTLKGGHTFVSVQTDQWGADAGDYSATLPSVADIEGKSSLSLNVPWSIGGDDRVTYSIDLWVQGPLGVSGW
jgi:hypothetical protein